MDKRNQLRQHKLAIRDNLSPRLREKMSRSIKHLLLSHPAVTAADHLFMYVHFRSEVSTLPLLETLLSQGKGVSVPLTQLDTSCLLAVGITDPVKQLAPGCYGIPEPTPEQVAAATVDPGKINTVLVPGSVFDRLGGRLGYGGGFYDRFLTQSAPDAVRVGLAFEDQLTDAVPMQPHDQFMDMLVTEKRIYDCRRLRDGKDSNIQG